MPAHAPSVRIGRHWVSFAWLAAGTLIALAVIVALAMQLRTYGWVQHFIAHYPGTSASYAQPVTTGFPAWLRWQHFFNIIFMMFIIRSGLQILADHPRLYLNAGCRPGSEWFRMSHPVPADRTDKSDPPRVWTSKDDAVSLPKWLGIPGLRHSVGLARWWHFGFDLLWLINGVIFYVLLFSTAQWHRLVPQSWTVFPDAVSTAIQYASLNFPANEGFAEYNGLQILAYFITVFVAAPLAFITGLLQAPAVAARFGTGRGPFNRQVARTVHFAVLAWMLIFVVSHVAMVFATGAVGNLNHIVLGNDGHSYWAVVIFAVAALLVALLWAIGTPMTLRYPRAVQYTGRFVVGWAKAWMERAHPKASYTEKDITPYHWANGRPPSSAEPTAAGGQLSGLHAAHRRSRGEPDCPVLPRNTASAQTRTDHAALLHPGLVGCRQMGWGPHVRHPRHRASAPDGAVGGVLFDRRRCRSRHRPVLRLPPHRAHA